MQHLSKHLILNLAVLLVSAVSFAAVYDSNTEAFVCKGDCVTPTFQEQAYQRQLVRNGFKMQKTTVFLDRKTGKDLRKPVTSPKDIPGVGLVTRVYTENGETKASQGTGFLINECLMLTNNHAVNKANTKNKSITFEAGTFFNIKTEGEIVAEGGYLSKNVADYHKDWAVVKLNKNVASEIDPTTKLKIGSMEVLFAPEKYLSYAKDLTVVGRITDKEDDDFKAGKITLKRQEGCSAGGYTKESQSGSSMTDLINTKNLGTDCSALPGTSGSPIVVKDEEIYYAVGMMKNSPDSQRTSDLLSGENANVFLPFLQDPSYEMSFTEAKLKQIKAENPCNQ